MTNQQNPLCLVSYASFEDWDIAYESSIGRNFFLSSDYRNAILKVRNYQLRVLAFQFDAFRVILPVYVTKKERVLLEYWYSTPPHHYGGILSDKELTEAHWNSIIAFMERHWILHTLRISFTSDRSIPSSIVEKQVSGFYTTHMLDLSKGFDHIFYKKFQDRDQILKAKQAGISIRRENSLSGVEQFYRLYLISCQRWNKPDPEPLQFFTQLIVHSASVDLWIASKAGIDVATIVIANNGRDTAYYLYGASDANYWNDRPNDLLLSAAIEYSCQQGYRYFDFLPSGKIQSVEKFKEKFGAVKTEFKYLQLFGYFPSVKHKLQDLLNGRKRCLI